MHMRFQKSSGLRLQLAETDMAQLSAPEKIQRAIDSCAVIALDIYEAEDLIGFAIFAPMKKTGIFSGTLPLIVDIKISIGEQGR